MSEADHQIAVVQYLRLKKIPHVATMNENIWSGVIRALLGRALATKIISAISAKMTRMGKAKGVTDLFIAVPSNGHCGLWIEMKSKKGRVTKEQDTFMKTMIMNGYSARVCRSAGEAIKAIDDYLE